MIWIVICDGSVAKIFTKEQQNSPLQHLESFTHPHESTSKHGRDKPGRNFENASMEHHAYVTRSDWHERQKRIFIATISAHLLNAFKENKFSKIYFICPAKLVKIFRNYFDKNTNIEQKNRLSIIEIHRDLIHLTTEELDNSLSKEDLS